MAIVDAEYPTLSVTSAMAEPITIAGTDVAPATTAFFATDATAPNDEVIDATIDDNADLAADDLENDYEEGFEDVDGVVDEDPAFGPSADAEAGDFEEEDAEDFVDDADDPSVVMTTTAPDGTTMTVSLPMTDPATAVSSDSTQNAEPAPVPVTYDQIKMKLLDTEPGSSDYEELMTMLNDFQNGLTVTSSDGNAISV